MMGKEYVASVLKDFRTADISKNEKALYALVEKAGTASHAVTREDIEAVRATGWSDEAIFDALTVVSLFKFYNTWIDATGVHGLPGLAYGMLAKRMVTAGYAPL